MDLKNLISRNKEATIIITAFLIAQLYLLKGIWTQPLSWDPAIYSAMGQHLYTGGELGLWESYRPILLPVILGLFHVFNIPFFGYPQLLMTLISTTGLAGIYKFAKEDFNKETAIYATGITASSGIFIFNAGMIRAETLSMIFIMTSIYLLNKEKQTLSGIAASLAFLTRFPAAIVGLSNAITNIINTTKEKQFREMLSRNTKLTLGFSILTGLFFLHSHLNYSWVLEPIIRGIKVPAGNPETQLYGVYYLKELTLSQPLLALTPIGALLAIRNNKYEISPYLTGLIILYSFQEYFPHKESRYSIIFLPIAAIYSAKTIQKIRTIIQPKIDKLDKNKAKNILVILLTATLIFQTLQIQPQKNWSTEGGKEFLDKTQKLPEDSHIIGNHPNIAVYSQKQYTHLPIGYIYSTIERTDNITHVALNSCAWYETTPEKQEEINNFQKDLEQNHKKQLETGGETCTYTIYQYNK